MDIYKHYEISVIIVKIIEGINIGCIGLIRSYPDFSSIAPALKKLYEKNVFRIKL